MNSLLETCRLSASVAVRCLCAFAAASAPAASAQSDGDTAGVPVAIGDLVLWVENVTGDIAEDLALTEVQSACLRDSKAANEERVRAAEARIEEVMLMTREGYTIEQLGIDRDEVIPSRWELISNIMMGLEPCLTEAQIEKLAVWYERLSGPAAAYIGFCGMLAADAHGVLLVYCEGHWRAMEEKLASSYDEQQRASALDAFFAAFANAVGGDPVTRMTEWRERVKVEESIQAHFGTHEQVVGDSVVPEVPDGWLDRRMWSELSEKRCV